MRPIALVAPYLPAPANTGGRIRIHRLARALAQHLPVDLYARAWPVELAPAAGDVTSALSVFRRRALFGGGLPAPWPFFAPRRALEATPRALVAALARAHASEPYGLVVICHSHSFAAARALAGVPSVLDEHNIESRYAEATGQASPREYTRLRRWERLAWQGATLVTAVTPDDAAHIARVRPDVTVVPNGVAAREIAFVPPSMRSSRTMLFVGAMSHAPNITAAVELVREVLPRVRERVADTRVVLCGRAPSPEVLALASPQVTVTGTVPDVAPWLTSAGAYVNLLRAGAGSSLKVPEALASGVPLVTTVLGARGFGLRDGVHGAVVHSAREAAEAVLAAWRDPNLADRRAHEGRRIADTLDWDVIGDDFARHALALCTGGGR